MSLFNGAKTVTFVGKSVTKLELDGTKIWEAVTFKNWVQYSTETDGVTIYNGGLGYKDGYRVRSGGAEAEQTNASITGYIPYKKGDKLYIYPPFNGFNVNNTVNFYDSTYANLGQVTDSGLCYGQCTLACKTTLVNGVSVLDLSDVTASMAESVAFVRIGNNIDGGVITSGSEMIITKNEEIPL